MGVNLPLKLKQFLHVFSLAALTLAGTGVACAQAAPTATASLRISGFAGVSANYTGLELAKNGDFTAGIDLGFRPFRGFYPSVEARGMYPIDKGQVVHMENIVGGLRLGRQKDKFNPYGDVLYGRGRLDFPNGYPTPDGTFVVLANTSSVLSFGGGLDYMFSEHWGAKGDFQFQRYQTPVTVSGSLYSKVFTAGIVYRLGTGGVRGLRGRRF